MKSPIRNWLLLMVKLIAEKSGLPTSAAMSGVSRSLVKAETTVANAAPTTTPTAMSTTFPRRMNCLNPLSIGASRRPKSSTLRGTGQRSSTLRSCGDSRLGCPVEQSSTLRSQPPSFDTASPSRNRSPLSRAGQPRAAVPTQFKLVSLLDRSFHAHRSRSQYEIDVPLLVQLHRLRKIDHAQRHILLRSRSRDAMNARALQPVARGEQCPASLQCDHSHLRVAGGRRPRAILHALNRSARRRRRRGVVDRRRVRVIAALLVLP